MPALIGSLLATLVRLSGPSFWLLLALMLGLGISEGVGLLLLLPLLELIGIGAAAGEPSRLTSLIGSAFALAGLRPTTVGVLAIYVAVVAVRSLLSGWQSVVQSTVQNRFMARLRQQLYRAIVNTDWRFFSRNRASDFVHALNTEIDRVGLASQALLALMVEACLATAYLLFALYLAAPVTGLVVLCGVGLWLALRRRTEAARAAGETISRASASLHAAASEHLAGLKVARGYGVQERNSAIFSGLAEQLAEANVGAARNQAGVRRWFDLGAVLLLSAIVAILIDLLAMPAASVLLVLFAFYRLIPRFASIQRSYQYLASTVPAFAMVAEMQARCEAEAEREPGRERPLRLGQSVRLEEVSFSYGQETEARPAIDRLRLTIQAGQTTAIVGPSGAGKSTVCDLVMGLLTPDRGQLLVDDQPLTPDRLRAWRDQLGYVPQDSFLLHDTVRANLLWARPDASERELSEALRLAAADRFVAALPRQLDTPIGDRGVLLSGGERQRLALARALLRRPVLLILDEATSSLDAENERRIQQAIERLHGRMTILVITHRLSTVRGADIIYVLDRGRLVESGRWDELLAHEGGRLRALCEAQGIEPARLTALG